MSHPKSVVIFDMDGTLTRPQLDFDRIRQEIGIVSEPLLEAVEKLPPDERSRAEAILHQHESEAAATSELQPGAAKVVASIRAEGLPVALMTRNSRASVDAFQRRHRIEFDLIRTREDGVVKPSPTPVLEICEAFRGDPSAAWVIGDYHYDILCGVAAGATTVLLASRDEPPAPWASEAHHVIHDLPDLLPLLGLTARHPIH